MNRRDLLLQEMNIPQWELRKPQVLKGEAAIRLPETIKLVIVCPQNYSKTGFFRDLKLALQLDDTAVQWLDSEQAERLDFSHSPTFWLIGINKQADNFAKKMANCTAWQNASWEELREAENKRKLWRNIQDLLVEK
jgi:DNA polymerase-3 subunit psi